MKMNRLIILLAIMCATAHASSVEKVHNDKQTTTFNNSLDPQGQTLYFTQVAQDASRIMLMQGTLSEGKVIAISQLKIDDRLVDGTDIHLSPDGNKLLYVARQPFGQSSPRNDYNVYVSNKTAAGWSTPQPLPAAINSSADEFHPSLSARGDIYFARRIKDDNLDIFVSRLVDGTYQPATRFGDEINSGILEGDVFVSADERVMLFARMKGDDSLGMTDLYVSYNQAGKWTEAQNMGSKVNSVGIDGSPFISRDNQWLYFTSSRDASDPSKFDHGLGLYRVAFDAFLPNKSNDLKHAVQQ